jgi:hypothetical protein
VIGQSRWQTCAESIASGRDGVQRLISARDHDIVRVPSQQFGELLDERA